MKGGRILDPVQLWEAAWGVEVGCRDTSGASGGQALEPFGNRKAAGMEKRGPEVGKWEGGRAKGTNLLEAGMAA